MNGRSTAASNAIKCSTSSSSVGLKKKGVVTRAASAPRSSASLVSSIVSLVPMAPVPAITIPRPPTFSLTNSMSPRFSSLESRGPSPVLAFTTRPETPASSQNSTRSARDPFSISPFSSKGVTLGTNIPSSFMTDHRTHNPRPIKP